jgi:polar amino acid transport system substrate-binding protein
MNFRARPIRIAALFLAAALSMFAAPVLGRDIAEIKRSGFLVSAIPAFNAPPFFFEKNGVLRGIDIDLARGIGQSLGVDVRFNRDGTTFNEVCKLVAAGKADLAAAKISRTVQRAEYLLFSKPYIALPHALMLNRIDFAKAARGRPVAQVMQEYDGAIGVIAGSSFADYGRINFPKAALVTFPSWDEVIAAVAGGTVSAAYRDAYEIRAAFKRRPDLAVHLRSVVIDDVQDTIGVAVGGDNFLLQNYINLYLDQRNIHYTLDQIGKLSEQYGF